MGVIVIANPDLSGRGNLIPLCHCENPHFFCHCEERSKPVPAKAGIHLSVIARSEATRQSPLQKVKSVPLLTTIFPKKKDFLNLCRILYIILNIFQLNDFFRILEDIILLYSRTYAWRKVKCVPLDFKIFPQKSRTFDNRYSI